MGGWARVGGDRAIDLCPFCLAALGTRRKPWHQRVFICCLCRITHTHHPLLVSFLASVEAPKTTARMRPTFSYSFICKCCFTDIHRDC